MKRQLINSLGLMFVVLMLQACGSRIHLFQDLDEADANEIYSVLLDSGIPAQKEPVKGGCSTGPDATGCE